MGQFGLKNGLDEFLDAALHISIVRNRTGYGGIAGPVWGDALLHQGPGVDQQSGTHTFFKPMVSEISYLFTQFD